MRNTLMAGASSFAHLLGRTPKAAKKSAADDDRKPDDFGDDEGDDGKDGKKAKRRAENTERDEENDERKEDEADEDGAEGDDPDEDEDDGENDAKRAKKKAKKAKADDGDDDDEEGDDGSDGADMRSKSSRSARLRERARCAAIFAHDAAGKNPALAAQLAFGTDLSRTQAINVLKAGGLAVASQPKRASLDERMARVSTPVAGAGGVATPTGVQGLAARIVAAGKVARGG